MNTFTKKPNFSGLLSFCIVSLFFLSSISVLAQPNSFTVSGCGFSSADGTYTRDATDALGCPCYNNASGGIIYKGGSNWTYNPNTTCGSPFAGANFSLYSGGGSCDITTSTSNLCDPSTTLNVAPAPSSIPTLSEWGLIILALLFMTFGTLYLVQPNVEERIGK